MPLWLYYEEEVSYAPTGGAVSAGMSLHYTVFSSPRSGVPLRYTVFSSPRAGAPLTYWIDGLDEDSLGETFDVLSALRAVLLEVFDVLQGEVIESTLDETFDVFESPNALYETFDVVTSDMQAAFSEDVQMPVAVAEVS